MRFIETTLQGAFIIDLERYDDRRGFFARTYCAREFEAHNLISSFVQCNTSFNYQRGTLRGLHYQAPPHLEAKLVRCTRGSIYDVIVDLRPDSASFGAHFALELSPANGRSLHIPAGFAHGFQTLEDETEVFYQMSNYYVADCAAGLRYDDAEIGICWPLPVSVISEKDLNWPSLADWQNPFKSPPSESTAEIVSKV
jgi:dTDP-4-dehydrorhamnose 3,5-epimerase